ncbi:MAG: ABC transporter substrate-binding protein, partial [Alphaproteobacteria bacterium]
MRLPRLALGLLCSLPLLSLACSDDGSSAPAPIVVGVLAPVEGGLVDFGRGIADSVRLAVDEQAGTILPGRDVRVIVRDDASDPEKGAAAAAELARNPHVAAVVGPYNSGVAQAALPVLAPAGVALVSPSNTLTTLTHGGTPQDPTRPWPTYFRLVGADVEQAAFLARRARASGYGRAAVVSETKAVSKGLADDFVAAFAANGGVVTVRALVPDDAKDFSAFLAEAIPTSPDLVFFGGEYPVAATLRKQASAAGLDVPVMGGDGIMGSGEEISIRDLTETVAWACGFRGRIAWDTARPNGQPR